MFSCARLELGYKYYLLLFVFQNRAEKLEKHFWPFLVTRMDQNLLQLNQVGLNPRNILKDLMTSLVLVRALL